MVKFGFSIEPMDLNSTISLISFAEKLGYDYVWMSDQTFYRDPYVILGAIALNTKKIQIGVSVTNPYTRHPAMTARAVATVDELSGGRMNLGIGSGNHKELLYPLGFKLKNAAKRCKDAAIIAKRLFKGEHVTYEGEIVAKGIKLNFKTRRDIPIYIAGQGPKVLEVAGEVADGVIIGSLITKRGLDYAFNKIIKGAKKTGRSIKDIDLVSWCSCKITDARSRADFIRERKPGVARIIGIGSYKILNNLDIDEDIINVVKQEYKKGGIKDAAKYVPDEIIEKINVFGTAQKCADRIEKLFNRGITQFSFLILDRELDSMKNTLEEFSHEIISGYHSN